MRKYIVVAILCVGLFGCSPSVDSYDNEENQKKFKTWKIEYLDGTFEIFSVKRMWPGNRYVDLKLSDGSKIYVSWYAIKKITLER